MLLLFGPFLLFLWTSLAFQDIRRKFRKICRSKVLLSITTCHSLFTFLLKLKINHFLVSRFFCILTLWVQSFTAFILVFAFSLFFVWVLGLIFFITVSQTRNLITIAALCLKNHIFRWLRLTSLFLISFSERTLKSSKCTPPSRESY